MTLEVHVDGNSLGGLFHDLFGREMTEEECCCDSCGTVSPLGAVLVYKGPADVIRCPACRNVLMVIVASANGLQVRFQSLRWMAFTGRAE